MQPHHWFISVQEVRWCFAIQTEFIAAASVNITDFSLTSRTSCFTWSTPNIVVRPPPSSLLIQWHCTNLRDGLQNALLQFLMQIQIATSSGLQTSPHCLHKFPVVVVTGTRKQHFKSIFYVMGEKGTSIFLYLFNFVYMKIRFYISQHLQNQNNNKKIQVTILLPGLNDHYNYQPSMQLPDFHCSDFVPYCPFLAPVSTLAFEIHIRRDFPTSVVVKTKDFISTTKDGKAIFAEMISALNTTCPDSFLQLSRRAKPASRSFLIPRFQ